jgi:FkbM family methyltransferase
VSDLLANLKRVEQLATIGKAGRLLHQPLRYLSSQTFLKFIYPYTRKGWTTNAKTFFGTNMQVFLPAGTDIYLTGGKTHDSEIRLARYMINYFRAGQTYFDIGAHFGYYTLLASALVGDEGKVYAFEAAQKTYSVLKHNVQTHKNIQALHNAVSDVEELISFYEFPILYSEYNSLNPEQFENEEWLKKNKPVKTEVRAVTLDLFTETLFQKPDYIKIDVEGAEDKVIQGCVELLKKYSPIVMMEYLSDSRTNSSHRKAAAIMYANGYAANAINSQGHAEIIDDIDMYMSEAGIDSDNIIFIKRNSN